MNFREFCKSSFFVCVLVLLLLAAAGQMYASHSGGMVASVSAETSEEALEAGQPMSGEVKDDATLEETMPAEEETIERDENSEDSRAVPEETPAEVPEEEHPAEDPQMVNTLPPGAGQEVAELAVNVLRAGINLKTAVHLPQRHRDAEKTTGYRKIAYHPKGECHA